MKTAHQYDYEIQCLFDRFYSTGIHSHLDRALALTKEKQKKLDEEHEQRYLVERTAP